MKLHTPIYTHDESWDQDTSTFSFIEKEFDNIVKKTLNYVEEFYHFDFPDKHFEIELCLVGDSEIQQYNKEHRGKDKPTNVLSFPIYPNWQDLLDDAQKNDSILMGSIICSYQTISKEAVEKDIPLTHHLTHMVVHSILHLLGFDHIQDEEAEIMENHEKDILLQLSIPLD